MAETTLDALSDEELMDQWTALGDEVQAGKERLKAFSAEHQRRTRQAELRRRMSDMTPEDMALVQGITAEGIESQAEVGTV